MGRIVEVRLWDASGRPLIADIEVPDPQPYRRRFIGFFTTEERDSIDEYIRRGGDERPSFDPEADEDTEGEVFFEEEEGCSEECTCQ